MNDTELALDFDEVLSNRIDHCRERRDQAIKHAESCIASGGHANFEGAANAMTRAAAFDLALLELRMMRGMREREQVANAHDTTRRPHDYPHGANP